MKNNNIQVISWTLVSFLFFYVIFFVGYAKFYLVGVMFLTTIAPFVQTLYSDIDYFISFAVILVLVNIFFNTLKKILKIK